MLIGQLPVRVIVVEDAEIVQVVPADDVECLNHAAIAVPNLMAVNSANLLLLLSFIILSLYFYNYNIIYLLLIVFLLRG